MKTYTLHLLKIFVILTFSLSTKAQFLPCAFFSYPDSSSAFTYIFYAQPAGTANTYHWDLGDGTTATGPQLMHSYNGPGPFIVCLSELDSAARIMCTSCDTIYPGGAILNCNFNYYYDLLDSLGVHFSSTTGPNVMASWDFGDGHTAINDPNPSHQFPHSGTFNVCLTLTDTMSSPLLTCTQCTQVQITSGGGGPVCSFTVMPDTGANTSMVFTGRFMPGVNVSWTFGDGTAGHGSTAYHSYTAPGNYLVCMTESDSSGNVLCHTCDTVLVNSNPVNQCQFTYSSSVANYLQINFDATDIPGTHLYWNFGDGSPDTAGYMMTHLYASVGQYNVCTYRVDAVGDTLCVNCITVSVQNSQPSICQAGFQAVNLGLTVHFIDVSTIDPARATYNWTFGDGSTSNIRFPQHQYNHIGTYQACLTVTDSICSSTFCALVIVDTTINNPIFCNAFFVPVQMAPYQMVLVDMSSGINLNYHWDFGDGNSSNLHYPGHTYASTGSYNICLTVSSTSPNGTNCTHTYCDTISVDSLGNMFRLNNPGFTINVVSPDQLTGVPGIENTSFTSAYPNPVHDILNIHVESKGESVYKLLNVNGSVVKEGRLLPEKNTLNTSDWNAGFYLLEITRNDGSRNYLKIVKE